MTLDYSTDGTNYLEAFLKQRIPNSSFNELLLTGETYLSADSFHPGSIL